MHYVYFAEKKLERFYDSLVERTEVTTTRATTKEVSGKAEAKVKTKLGSLLSRLGIADVEMEAGATAEGKVAFSREVVSHFASA